MNPALVCLIVLGPAGFQTAASSPAQRATELFREAREAIDSVQGPSVAGMAAADVAAQMRAGLWLELAKSEAVALPEAAADDAARAMRVVAALPGGGRDFDQGRAADPAARPALLGWMAKAQIEPDVIKVLVYVKQIGRALELARVADIAHADLYDPILRVADPDQILGLAAECRAADGTYPYVAIADRARATNDAAVQRALLDASYGTVARETEFNYRSLALGLVERTYDLMPPETVARVLAELLQHMTTNPASLPGSARLDRDFFGPQILELMMWVDPARAASLAADHPDWEAERKIPGRTIGNPVGGPGPGVRLRPATPPPPPPPRPMKPLDAMTAAQFEQALEQARALPQGGERIQRLIALGYLLLTKPLSAR